MARRVLGRDPGLTVRMSAALALLLAIYTALLAGVVWLAVHQSLYWIAVAVALAGTVVLHYRAAASSLLRAVSAQVVEADDVPDVVHAVARLAALADIPVPRLAVAETDAAWHQVLGLRSARRTARASG